MKNCSFLLALSLVAALSGCSDDPAPCESGVAGCRVEVDTGTDTDVSPDSEADVEPDAPTDSEAPEYRDVRISVGGDFSVEVDLGEEDESHILPATAPATFKLFVSDDTTEAENLSVEIVDAEGNALTPTDGPTLRNGLWNVTVEIGPGISVSPQVTDEAGNVAAYEAALVIPTRQEAVVDQWRTLLYDEELSIRDRRYSTYAEDGTWEGYMESAPGELTSGTFSFTDDDKLDLRGTWSDGDRWKRVGDYYVDETYFAFLPLVRQGEGDGIVGTWIEQRAMYVESNGSFEFFTNLERTLTIHADGTWQETSVADETNQTLTRSGTYRVEVNGGYAANFGDFLVRTTTHEDGVALDTPVEGVDLFVIRLDHLLITPQIRGHGD